MADDHRVQSGIRYFVNSGLLKCGSRQTSGKGRRRTLGGRKITSISRHNHAEDEASTGQAPEWRKARNADHQLSTR